MLHLNLRACLVIGALSMLSGCGYDIETNAGAGGRIEPAWARPKPGHQTTFELTPDAGYFIAGVEGCNGTLKGNRYTTAPFSERCEVTAVFLPELKWRLKGGQLHLSWPAANGASHYRVFESEGDGRQFRQIGGDVKDVSTTVGVSLLDYGAKIYRIEKCRHEECSTLLESHVVLSTPGSYVKASNTEKGDAFGSAVALSGDGNTLAVGAPFESGGGKINGNQADNSVYRAGAVYVYSRTSDGWRQQAYLKAERPAVVDRFGYAVALSADGSTLAVGAIGEDHDLEEEPRKPHAGAVFLFTRAGREWSQQGMLKGTNTVAGDNFGGSVALSGDGNVLAVGAMGEDSSSVGINGDGENDSAPGSGAVYLFIRDGHGWRQHAYIKASNTGAGDAFGSGLALSHDGNRLAVGARSEDGALGDEGGDSISDSGAVYIFGREGEGWRQQQYLKASNAGRGDRFGASVSISGNGSVLAVGAPKEDSSSLGLNGDEGDNRAVNSGAAYLFTHTDGGWVQQAYVKAFNTGAYDGFGTSLALSNNGEVLACGAYFEAGSTARAGSGQDNLAAGAGAIYLFTQANGSWRQRSYIKAFNPGRGDLFGERLALSGNGETLATGARGEDGHVTGIGRAPNENAEDAGAAYIF